MRQAIIIATHKKFKPWLLNFIKTYSSEYVLLFTYNTDESNRYDVKAVLAGIETKYDEFLVFHDTIEIKDNSLFDIVFKEYEGRSVFLRKKSCMFLVKYTKKDLAKLTPQHIQNLYDVKGKLDAVSAEGGFNNLYMQASDPIFLFQDFIDGGVREHKFGRKNMILENKFIKKYKGSWDMEGAMRSESYVPTEE